MLGNDSLNAINASIQTYLFKQGDKQFVEVNYLIPVTDLEKVFIGSDSFQYKVLLTVALKQSSRIIKADKVMLSSPTMTTDHSILHSMRWVVDPGNYELESTLSDFKKTENQITLINPIVVNAWNSNIHLSDIQLFLTCKSTQLKSGEFVKNGIQYEPLPYQIIDKNQNILNSYCELYHYTSLEKQGYVFQYELYKQDSNKAFVKITDWYKAKSNPENGIIIHRKDISSLPSGHYKLKISILNKNKSLLDSKSVEFDRLNPFWDRLLELQYANISEEEFFARLPQDSIHYYLRALNVILPSTERDMIKDLDQPNKSVESRMYLYHFWRDHFGEQCVERFQKFMKLVRYADQNFIAGFRYGFESDRGITYIKYGAPIEIIHEENDNGAFPYEIWMYDKLPTGQTNVRFLFYNPDLAGGNFILLHTNCYGGRFNKQWELELYRKVKDEFDGENPVEATRIKSSVNRRAREYFEK